MNPNRVSALLVAAVACSTCGVSSFTPATAHCTRYVYRPDVCLFRVWAPSSARSNDDDEGGHDENNGDDSFPDEVDMTPDAAQSFMTPKLPDDVAKLGIEIGKMLEPLSEKDAAELKAAATEIINDSIASGLDEIAALRSRMERELTAQQDKLRLESEWKSQQESDKLMSKIDTLTEAFLAQTKASRRSTQLAAAADAGSSGKGVEIGVWGTVNGMAVPTTAGGAAALMGSVSDAMRQSAKSSSGVEVDNDGVVTAQPHENKVVVVADVSGDAYAKQLLGPLTKSLQGLLPGLQVSVHKPTATLPLGGENAATVLLFLTSLSDSAAVKNALDRLLRKTMSVGSMGTPPTQIVAVSTIGTSRTDKMPYSMQNMMGGRKLEKRQQMEESIQLAIQNRDAVPALDYTVCKFGDLQTSVKDAFAFAPGDALQGNTQIDTAVQVLSQAIALQPAARNATFSCVGALPPDAPWQVILDDAFLKLDGPEVLRLDLDGDAEANYGQLFEYMCEWGELLAKQGKGLTTPIRFAIPASGRVLQTPGIVKQARLQLLFLPTKTGRNYLSRDEEKERERTGQRATATNQTSAQEGGVEVVVEVTSNSNLRVRAKRCNYRENAVLKEITEETILNQLKKAIEVWKKNRANIQV